MPLPTGGVTETEIVDLAEVLLVSYDDALTLVAAGSSQAVSDAKWEKAKEYIEAWPGIRDEANDIKRVGSIEFFESTAGSVRLNFRNTVRALYGLAPLASELMGAGGTQPAFTSLNWF